MQWLWTLHLPPPPLRPSVPPCPRRSSTVLFVWIGLDIGWDDSGRRKTKQNTNCIVDGNSGVYFSSLIFLCALFSFLFVCLFLFLWRATVVNVSSFCAVFPHFVPFHCVCDFGYFKGPILLCFVIWLHAFRCAVLPHFVPFYCVGDLGCFIDPILLYCVNWLGPFWFVVLPDCLVPRKCPVGLHLLLRSRLQRHEQLALDICAKIRKRLKKELC